ncbi:MAG TPA: hypothetical protein VHS99_01300 [Chloroflexota bacterium]|nr:hypothetical protein [Chloroflexota bacterium]
MRAVGGPGGGPGPRLRSREAQHRPARRCYPRHAAQPALALFASALAVLLVVVWYLRPLPGAEAAGAHQVPAAAASQYGTVSEPPREIQVPATAEHPAYTIYTPGGLPSGSPSTITLLALHGMGGNGPGIAAPVLPFARARGWTVIAPTINYGDWRDPNQLISEELGLQPQLARLLDAVPAETGITLGERVLLFGFSRGAQASLRFALLYPERVEAVAAVAAGTYTLPAKTIKTAAGTTLNAPLPYGVADLEQRMGRGLDQLEISGVRFWIGVGSKDNRDGDVPRQWDQFVGRNRVERAERFANALGQAGFQVQLTIVPDAGHELSAPMVSAASAFLNGVAQEMQAQLAAATTSEPVPAPTRRTTRA